MKIADILLFVDRHENPTVDDILQHVETNTRFFVEQGRLKKFGLARLAGRYQCEGRDAEHAALMEMLKRDYGLCHDSDGTQTAQEIEAHERELDIAQADAQLIDEAVQDRDDAKVISIEGYGGYEADVMGLPGSRNRFEGYAYIPRDEG